MSASDGVYVRVVRVLADSLNVGEDEVTPQATLQGDLGAESIDFLDIVFRLEREFGIKIDRDEQFPESIFQGNPEFAQDGKVTAKGLAELRQRMPFADLTTFERNPEVARIGGLFTVDLIARYVRDKLEALGT